VAAAGLTVPLPGRVAMGVLDRDDPGPFLTVEAILAALGDAP
jgi:hypothetical protein